jgi:hypothetical protein
VFHSEKQCFIIVGLTSNAVKRFTERYGACGDVTASCSISAVWKPEAGARRKILVANSARLYGFKEII